MAICHRSEAHNTTHQQLQVMASRDCCASSKSQCQSLLCAMTADQQGGKQTCIASSPGAGDSQVFQERMRGLLTGSPPGFLLGPYLLQVTAIGPQINPAIAVQLQALHSTDD